MQRLSSDENAEYVRLLNESVRAYEQYCRLLDEVIPVRTVSPGTRLEATVLTAERFEQLQGADERRRLAQEALDRFRRDHNLPPYG